METRGAEEDMAITRSMAAIILAGLMCASANAQNAAKSADPLPRAKPEEVGMSSERLADIAKTLNADITRGQMPGAVLAVARHGRLAYFEAFGYRDKAANAAMTTDAIFNIASMTKPMTAVAALQLYEHGKLLMDEPLAKYFPKFADMQVAVLDARKETIIDKVPAARKITIQDLFRHTSGFSYGGRGTTAVHKLYPEGSGQVALAYTGTQFPINSRRCRCTSNPARPGTMASVSTCSASWSSNSPSRRSAPICRTMCSSRSAWWTQRS
jgi:CubicO group peptidase (beta-lactamase class C family)